MKRKYAAEKDTTTAAEAAADIVDAETADTSTDETVSDEIYDGNATAVVVMNSGAPEKVEDTKDDSKDASDSVEDDSTTTTDDSTEESK